MEKASIFIVEDEALIADHIVVCLEDFGYEVSGTAASAAEALEDILKTKPDLVLIDIHLDGPVDGVDLAHRLNLKYPVPFIFLTSNSDPTTVDRLKLTEPAGYISKPYQPRDLASNISIALYKSSQIKSNSMPQAEVESESHFFVKDKHALVKINYQDIQYAEAMDNYTRLVTKDKRFVLSSTLKTVEQKLRPHGFFRVHRSYLVNLQKIDQILPKQLVVQGAKLPLSESARKTLLELISTF